MQDSKIWLLALLIVVIPFVVSQTVDSPQTQYIYKQNEFVNFTFICFDSNGTLCTAGTSCQINSLVDSQGKLILANVSLQYQGAYYNYTLPTSVLGIYDVVWSCHGNNSMTADFTYYVTINGKVASTGDSIFYVVLLVLSALFDIFLIWLIFTLDTKNYKDQSGEFIGINLKKYGRILLVGVTYLFILVTLNLMVSVAASLSYLSQFAGLIGMVFTIMLKLIIPWTIFIFIWMITMMIKDYNLVQDIRQRLEEIGRI